MQNKRKFSDFGSLKKDYKVTSVEKRQPARPVPSPDSTVASAKDPRDLFAMMMGDKARAARSAQQSHNEVAGMDVAVDSLETSEAALDKLAGKLVVAEAERDDARDALQKSEAGKQLLSDELEHRDAEILRLQSELEASKKLLKASIDDDPEIRLLKDEIDGLSEKNKRLRRDLAAARSTGILLTIPDGLEEVFQGETAAHVLAAISEAQASAVSGGRDRRAAVLEKVLASNSSNDGLEMRREAVRKIIRDAGKSIDDSAIQALAKLGFRDVSNNKHHKLRWADVTVMLAGTPSDARSADNAAAEINNRVF